MTFRLYFDQVLKFECINAVLEAAKMEMNLVLLSTQEIICKLVKGLSDLPNCQSSERKLLQALHLLNIDGTCSY